MKTIIIIFFSFFLIACAYEYKTVNVQADYVASTITTEGQGGWQLVSQTPIRVTKEEEIYPYKIAGDYYDLVFKKFQVGGKK
jgi:hypothetical protein